MSFRCSKCRGRFTLPEQPTPRVRCPHCEAKLRLPVKVFPTQLPMASPVLSAVPAPVIPSAVPVPIAPPVATAPEPDGADVFTSFRPTWEGRRAISEENPFRDDGPAEVPPPVLSPPTRRRRRPLAFYAVIVCAASLFLVALAVLTMAIRHEEKGRAKSDKPTPKKTETAPEKKTAEKTTPKPAPAEKLAEAKPIKATTLYNTAASSYPVFVATYLRKQATIRGKVSNMDSNATVILDGLCQCHFANGVPGKFQPGDNVEVVGTVVGYKDAGNTGIVYVAQCDTIRFAN